MIVALVDYGAGNLRSAQKGLERVARETGSGHSVVLTADPETVLKADRVVLPGDGAFPFCMKGLSAIPGMVAALREVVERRARPLLGICVGMQLMATRGIEHDPTDGFGWIDGVVAPIVPASPEMKIPHMGWNTMEAVTPHPVMEGLRLGPDGLHAYFLHSYVFEVAHRHDLVAVADYGRPLTAIVARDTIIGTQFHPEKSQTLGLRLIANFLKWAP